MATAFSPGGQSCSSLTRTVEKILEEAQHTGEVLLSGRKLKEYPKVSSKYDLIDTIHTDLSKNRFTEITPEVCRYHSMERLNCSHNVIRSIPKALIQLQALVHLNLSRNQLTTIPPFISQLCSLEVLIASNNRLVSLPEELGTLDKLMELDVSCNEITHLPSQLGDLMVLSSLNVRHNLLVEVPVEICRLQLRHLDLSQNRISHVPLDLRKMDTLVTLNLHYNPLQCPPAHIATKGRVHLMKFLHREAVKEDRKQNVLNDVDMRRSVRKLPSLQTSSTSEELQFLESPGERRKRHTTDSGYSTTDSIDRTAHWSPSEAMSIIDDSNMLTLRAADMAREQRSERMADGHKRLTVNVDGTIKPGSPQATSSPGSGGTMIQRPDFFPDGMESAMPDVDQFTRVSGPRQPPLQQQQPRSSFPSYDGGLSSSSISVELQRQKTAYEEKKRRAEQLRKEWEEEEKEREERRRAAIRLQEEQKALLDQKRGKSLPSSPAYASFAPDAPSGVVHNIDVQHYQSEGSGNSRLRSASPAMHRSVSPMPNNHVNSSEEDEFRRRYQAMISQQQHEAARIQQEVQRIRQCLNSSALDKQAYYNFIQQQGGSNDRWKPSDEDGEFSFSRDSTPNTSFESQSSTTSSKNANCTLPIAVQRGLEEIGKEINNMNPSFTIRRHIHQAQEDADMVQQLRSNIEGRLKVKLPEDLPSALRDGVVLCHLANHVRPRSVSSIHVPSPAVPKLSTAKCRRNIENFLEACRRIGVEQDKICPWAAILEEKGVVPLAMTVDALLGCLGNNMRHSAV